MQSGGARPTTLIVLGLLTITTAGALMNCMVGSQRTFNSDPRQRLSSPTNTARYSQSPLHPQA